MSKQKITEEQAKQSQDLALAQQFHDTYERLAPEFGYETREDTKVFDPESKNGKLMVAVAGQIRKQTIDPALITGSVRLLKAHRNALYDSIPVGDIDAMGLLNLIQAHLAKVDESIASLENAAKPVEVLDGDETPKPLDRMDAQEAEVVEDEDAKS